MEGASAEGVPHAGDESEKKGLSSAAIDGAAPGGGDSASRDRDVIVLSDKLAQRSQRFTPEKAEQGMVLIVLAPGLVSVA